MDEHTVARNDSRKCLSDIVGVSDCWIEGRVSGLDRGRQGGAVGAPRDRVGLVGQGVPPKSAAEDVYMSTILKILTSHFADHRKAFSYLYPWTREEGCDLRNLRDRVRTRITPRAGHICGSHSCVRTHVRALVRVARPHDHGSTQRVRSRMPRAEAAHPSG
eukprot:1835513-Prymnesium_polylepis.1